MQTLLEAESSKRFVANPAAPHVVASGAASTIRACEPGDLPIVARLFTKTFRNNRDRASVEIERHLHALLFEHPWRDPQLASQVSVDAGGHLNGFICVLPVRMTLAGRPVRAALASSLMVDEPEKDQLAGARLFRSYFKGPQDFSFSDSSNPVARRMWERLGGAVAPLYSMEWIRLLRPAQAACAFASGAVPAATYLRPFAAVLDRAVRNKLAALRIEAVEATAEETTADNFELLSLIIRLSGSYRLAPQWSCEDLRFILQQAGYKERYGSLVCTIVRDKNGKALGAFLYYPQPKGIAFVLQVLAEPGAFAPVIDTLLADAHARGCVAVRGRTQPELIGPLQQRRCLFVQQSCVTYGSKDPDIGEAARSGDALLTGLGGEAWTRLIGGFS